MPDDATLEFLKQNNIAAYTWLASAGRIKVDKSLPFFVNRVIWYNELDKAHTFSARNKNANANCAVVGHALRHGNMDEIPDLLMYYTLACYEHRDDPTTFTERDKFLQKWQTSPDDIHIFTRGEIRRYKEFKRDLANALAEVEGTGQASGANNDDVSDEELDEEAVTDAKAATVHGQPEQPDGTLGAHNGLYPAAMDHCPHLASNIKSFAKQNEHEDISMVDVGSQLYDEHMSGTPIDKTTREQHQAWVNSVYVAMEDRVRELVNQVPQNAVVIQRYLNQIKGLLDEDIMSRAMEQMGMKEMKDAGK